MPEIGDALLGLCRQEVERTGGRYRQGDTLSSAAAAVARWLEGGIGKPWLVLYGAVGTGKTTMAKAVMTMLSELRRMARREYDPLMQSMECRVSEDSVRPDPWDDLLRRLRQLSILTPTLHTVVEVMTGGPDFWDRRMTMTEDRDTILLVEDLGTEPPVVNSYGTRMTPLADLLYARYDRRLATVITTNHLSEGIEDIYGERIADRIRECGAFVGFGSESFRR